MCEFQRLTFKSKEEWRNQRKRIGGSDAAAILGLNPWKTNVDLWMEKTGQAKSPDISGKEFVKYGVAAEPLIRSLFALDFPQFDVQYYGDNLILNDKFPFGAASLDGELVERNTGRKGILEIKTTNILQSSQREKWNGKVPDYYYVQCIHYLMMTGYEFVVLVAQLKSEFNGELTKQTKHYFIEREDVLEDIKILQEKEAEFWKCVEERRRPNLVLPAV